MPITIPTITPDDLAHFRDSHLSEKQLDHFNATFVAGHLPEHHDGSHVEGVYAEEEEEEDDGLGYYPDGVKRTLTDEQIEICRWSEVWQEYKKRLRAQAIQSEEEEKAAREREQQTSPEGPEESVPLKRKWVKPAEDGGLPYDEEEVEDWEAKQKDSAAKAEEEAKRPKIVNRDGFMWPVLGS